MDHLVVVAADLDQGVAWCQATLGVTPGPGGSHPSMGTHNRLLTLAHGGHPMAYLEVIAIDPQAQPQLPPGNARWFDMDHAPLRERVTGLGPQLVHFVAAVPDIAAGVAACTALGIDRGAVVQASRDTPIGPLQWHISVRHDGQRLFDGCLPTLIQWGQRHPTHSMDASGIRLLDLRVYHPETDRLRLAFHALALSGVAVQAGAARISALLQTPKGLVHLHS